jgi:hypothetical protein
VGGFNTLAIASFPVVGDRDGASVGSGVADLLPHGEIAQRGVEARVRECVDNSQITVM